MQLAIANTWLSEQHHQALTEIGGLEGILEQITSGKSLIDIQHETGIPADRILMLSATSQDFSAALSKAMEIREAHTSEQIQSLANQYDSMIESQANAVNDNDMERLVLLQSLHDSQRKIMRERADVLKYIDIKNRTERASKRIITSFDEAIIDIEDITEKK